DVLRISSTSNTLTIDGGVGDSVVVSDGIWAVGPTVMGPAGQVYRSYTSDNARLLIDTRIQNLTIATRPVVTGVSSPNDDGTYRTGKPVDVVVTFDQAVTVTGSPTLLMETGTTDRSAVLVGGNGTNQLTFRYTVQPGDASPDLDYTSANALSLNG